MPLITVMRESTDMVETGNFDLDLGFVFKWLAGFSGCGSAETGVIFPPPVFGESGEDSKVSKPFTQSDLSFLFKEA